MLDIFGLGRFVSLSVRPGLHSAGLDGRNDGG